MVEAFVNGQQPVSKPAVGKGTLQRHAALVADLR